MQQCAACDIGGLRCDRGLPGRGLDVGVRMTSLLQLLVRVKEHAAAHSWHSKQLPIVAAVPAHHHTAPWRIAGLPVLHQLQKLCQPLLSHTGDTKSGVPSAYTPNSSAKSNLAVSADYPGKAIINASVYRPKFAWRHKLAKTLRCKVLDDTDFTFTTVHSGQIDEALYRKPPPPQLAYLMLYKKASHQD